MNITNPLYPALANVYSTLNTLNGILYQTTIHLDKSKNVYETKIKLNKSFIGSSLVISDLTESPGHGWREHFTSGSFSAKGEEILKTITVIVQRHCAWSVAQGYEAFETFLYDIISAYLAFCDNSRIQDPNEPLPTTQEEWRNYICTNKKYRNNKDIFKFIRRIAPQLAFFEKNNNRNLDLNEWYWVISNMRHAIVHSNSNIKSVKGWNSQKRKILEVHFPGKLKENTYGIELDLEHAKFALCCLGEYAFLIFKQLSIVADHKWQLFNKDE